MPMESRAKFLSTQNISGASQETSNAKFSLNTEVDDYNGSIQLVQCNPSPWKPRDPHLLLHMFRRILQHV